MSPNRDLNSKHSHYPCAILQNNFSNSNNSQTMIKVERYSSKLMSASRSSSVWPPCRWGSHPLLLDVCRGSVGVLSGWMLALLLTSDGLACMAADGMLREPGHWVRAIVPWFPFYLHCQPTMSLLRPRSRTCAKRLRVEHQNFEDFLYSSSTRLNRSPATECALVNARSKT